MTLEQNKVYMKNFFERYYEKLYNKNKMYVTLPGVPDEMTLENGEMDKEWKVWKLVPSTITNTDLNRMEDTYHIKLPIVLKAFFTAYHHFFEEPIGRHSINRPFFGFENSFNPILANCDFLPFAWDGEHYFIRCIDLSNMPTEEKCPIVEIDHEVMFNLIFSAEKLGENVTRDVFMKNMKPVAQNFYEFLKEVFNDRIK